MVVFVFAYVVRLLVPLLGGGLKGSNGYDAGIYYSAADALSHGLLPYRDFAMVHPPLIAYLLTPFAMFGRLTTDPVGFATATLAFIGIGALNATLVAAVAHRWGFSLRTAVTGGLLYAIFYAAIDAEFLTRLEPPGNTVLLLALFALAPERDGDEAPSHPFLAGLALGAGVSLKIWWALPAVVLLAVVVVRGRRRPWRGRSAWRVLLGGVIAAAAINLVPFAADPRGMIDLVIGQQFGRQHNIGSVMKRLAHMVGMAGDQHAAVPVAMIPVVFLLLLMIVWCAVRAVRTPLGGTVVPLLAAQAALILGSPSWFTFYSDYTAVAVTLTVTAALGAPRPDSAHPVSWLPAVPAVSATTAIAVLGGAGMLTDAPHSVGTVPDLAKLTATTSRFRCVMARRPVYLILTNSLDRSFAPGCRNWVDILGLGLDPTSLPYFPPLPANPQPWTQTYAEYLTSGQAILVGRHELVPQSLLVKLHHSKMVLSSDAMTIYRTRHHGRHRLRNSRFDQVTGPIGPAPQRPAPADAPPSPAATP